MSEILIEAHGLGKKYHRGYFARRGKGRGSDEFWALKDIDLELRAGEALGIIGPNGAGKSTLLKILSRVTVPTEGWMTVRGRVGALIELGAGFHPELSGRDNVYIAGSILGMPRKEITRRFEEIVEFAEIGEFIDMPVKKYSSGMYVRLGFAVAAHMDPEILLVDEVLAVGDGSFQKKCFGAMQRFREQGVSVILVSHSMYNIQRNCEVALCLIGGHVHSRGATEEIINDYQTLLEGEEGTVRHVDYAEEQLTKDMVITGVEVCHPSGGRSSEFDTGDGMLLRVDYETRDPGEPFHVRIVIVNNLGEILSVNDTQLEGQCLLAGEGRGVVTCHFPRLPLTSGQYALQVSLMDVTTRIRYDMWRGLLKSDLRFSVRPNAKSASLEQYRGLLDLQCEWQEAPATAGVDA